MSDDLLDKGQRDRSQISMGQPHEVQYWTRHLGVTKDELQRTIGKVGNSAAAVRSNWVCWESPTNDRHDVRKNFSVAFPML